MGRALHNVEILRHWDLRFETFFYKILIVNGVSWPRRRSSSSRKFSLFVAQNHCDVDTLHNVEILRHWDVLLFVRFWSTRMINTPVPVILLLVLVWSPIFATSLRPPGPSLSGSFKQGMLGKEERLANYARQLPYNFSWIYVCIDFDDQHFAINGKITTSHGSRSPDWLAPPFHPQWPS